MPLSVFGFNRSAVLLLVGAAVALGLLGVGIVVVVLAPWRDSAADDGAERPKKQEMSWCLKLPEPGELSQLTFFPDGKSLLAETRRGQLLIWNVETGNLRQSDVEDYHPQGGAKMRQHHFQKHGLRLEREQAQLVAGICFAHDSAVPLTVLVGAWLAPQWLTPPSTARIGTKWDADLGPHEFCLRPGTNPPQVLRWNTVVYHNYGQAETPQVCCYQAGVWTLDDKRLVGESTTWDQEEFLRHCGFATDGNKYLAVRGNVLVEFQARVVNNKLQFPAGEHDVPLEGLSFKVRGGRTLGDGATVVLLGYEAVAEVWDAKAGKKLHALEGVTRRIDLGEISADGTRLAAGSFEESVLRIWDTATGKMLRKLEGHTKPILAAALSADGKMALTLSGDKTLRLWDAVAGKVLTRLEFPEEPTGVLSFSADGKYVAVSCRTEVQVRQTR